MADRGTVVVVDDSPLLRTIIAETLDSITGIKVIGQAASGREGLQMIEALDPDIVSLDIEMGDLSGIEVLEAVMADSPRKVIMVSSHTEAGADVTLKALGLGAIDFVAKGRLDPGPDGFEARLRRTFSTALQARVVGPTAPPANRADRPARQTAPSAPPKARTTATPRPATPARPDPAKKPTAPGRRSSSERTAADRAASARKTVSPSGKDDTRKKAADHTAATRPVATTDRTPAKRTARGSAPAPTKAVPARTAANGSPSKLTKPDFVILASSTGGPPALQRFFGTLTAPLSVPMVVVQHMPESFTARLAARLDEMGPNSVREAKESDRLEAGVVLVAPGGFHLEVVNDKVHLNDSPAVGGLRPRADLTFESAIATRNGSRILGIVLTGMGDDGLEGSRQLIAAGGALIAQDADSCTVDGMPRQVRDAGLVSETGDPEALAQTLQRLASGRATVAPERTGVSR